MCLYGIKPAVIMMASNLATNSSSSTASTPTGKVCSASIGPVATLDAQENGCSPTDQRSRSPSPSEGKAGSNGIANGAALMENCSSSKNSQASILRIAVNKKRFA